MERTPGRVAFVSGQEELQRHPRPPVRRLADLPAPQPAQDRLRDQLQRPGPGDRRRRAPARPSPRCTAPPSWPDASPNQHTAQPQATGPPILLTTFTRNLADTLGSQLALLIEDDDVRDRVEVLNVDRLAYRIVAQARGANPAIADNQQLRAALGGSRRRGRRGRSPRLPPARVGAGHPRPGPAHRAGLPDLPARRAGHPARQDPSAARSGGRPSRSSASCRPPGSPPSSSSPTRPPISCASRSEPRTGT